jgi:hypothetical protein
MSATNTPSSLPRSALQAIAPTTGRTSAATTRARRVERFPSRAYTTKSLSPPDNAEQTHERSEFGILVIVTKRASRVRTSTLRAGLLVWAALVTVSSVAAAAPERPKEAAERLFNDARKLVREGKYGEACLKLEESERLDHALGTTFNLADCYEHSDRTALAHALFTRVALEARTAGKKERERSAAERASALEPKLARVTIVIAIGEAAPGIEVVVNDTQITEDELGKEIFVEPGSVLVAARAPERKEFRTQLVLGAGNAKIVAIPALAPVEPQAPPPPPRPTAPESPGWGPFQIGGVAAASAGVIALGIGTTFGLIAISKHDEASEKCPEPNPCNDAAAAATWTDATSAGTASSIAFAVAVVLVAGGAVLYFVMPKVTRRTAALSPALDGTVLRW